MSKPAFMNEIDELFNIPISKSDKDSDTDEYVDKTSSSSGVSFEDKAKRVSDIVKEIPQETPVLEYSKKETKDISQEVKEEEQKEDVVPDNNELEELDEWDSLSENDLVAEENNSGLSEADSMFGGNEVSNDALSGIMGIDVSSSKEEFSEEDARKELEDEGLDKEALDIIVEGIVDEKNEKVSENVKKSEEKLNPEDLIRKSIDSSIVEHSSQPSVFETDSKSSFIPEESLKDQEDNDDKEEGVVEATSERVDESREKQSDSKLGEAGDEPPEADDESKLTGEKPKKKAMSYDNIIPEDSNWNFETNDSDLVEFYEAKKRTVQRMLGGDGELPFDRYFRELNECKIEIPKNSHDLNLAIDIMRTVHEMKERVKEIKLICNRQFHKFDSGYDSLSGLLIYTLPPLKPAEKRDGAIFLHLNDVNMYMLELTTLHKNAEICFKTLDSAYDCLSRQITAIQTMMNFDPEIRAKVLDNATNHKAEVQQRENYWTQVNEDIEDEPVKTPARRLTSSQKTNAKPNPEFSKLTKKDGNADLMKELEEFDTADSGIEQEVQGDDAEDDIEKMLGL